MDLSAIMPLINMLTQSMHPATQTASTQPVQSTQLSDEDREFIRKNTSMFPGPFTPPNDFPRKKEPSITTASNPTSATRQNAKPMDLNSVLPLLNLMSGNHVDTAQISKLMQGMNGGGDLGGIFNLMSNFAKNNNSNIKKSGQIIKDKNDNFTKA